MMAWSFPARRLQNRLSWVLVLALVLPIGIVAWYAVRQSTQALVHTVEVDLVQDLKSRASKAQALLHQPRDDLFELSQNPRMRQALEFSDARRGLPEREVEALLLAFIDRSTGLYARAYWLNEKGHVLVATDASGRALNPAQGATLFSGAGELVSIPGRQFIFVGDPVKRQQAASAQDGLVIPYALSMRRGDGSLGGALVVELNAPRVFAELEKNPDGPEPVSTWVLDDRGHALGKPATLDANLWIAQRPQDAKVILARTSGALFDTHDRPDTLQVFARIRPLGQSAIHWTVVDEMPLNDALSEVHLAQGIIVALSLGCLLLALWGARRITRSIVRPLESLAHAARMMGEDNDDTALPTQLGTEEISDLTQAFAAMRIRIRRLLAEQRQTAGMLETSQRLSLIGGWEIDVRSNTVSCTEQTCRIHEMPEKNLTVDIPVAEVTRFYTPESAPVLQAAIDEALATGTPFDLTLQMRTVTGRLRWVHVVSVALTSADGHVLKLTGAIQDITARIEAEQALRIAATAFESQQGMTITDAQQVILSVNSAFTRITGYSADEVVGNKPSMLASGRHGATFYADMQCSIETTGAWQGEIWNKRKNGEIYPEWLMITAVKNEAGQVTHYVGSFADIAQRRKAEEKVHDLAFFDPLTQLPNRRLLVDRINQALASSDRSKHLGALLFIDLDNFRSLNDTLGHDAGDLLLQQVAQRLTACVREGDTVARVGGDEFVLILEDLSEAAPEAATQAETVGEKVLQALNQPYQLGNCLRHSTPSIGLTLFDDHQVGVDELLKRADLAMYQAKAAGRNGLRFFDPQMQEVVTQRSALEADLRSAVENSQFLLHYQAQVVGAGRVTGAEVLLRWQHPQRGMVSPAEFIPMAEETGLILPLGHWVLQTACAQLAAWAHSPATAHLTVAVNVSARQFRAPNFVDEVRAAIAHHRTNPQRLKLELTESLLVEDVEGVIAKMSELKAQGVGFSLDDFGTGYSSLSYLKRLPLDQLKIDQGFVRNILSDPNDAAIAKMVIALAESMGLSVIAEGVEIDAQKEFLARLGCHAYQGYLFSRPLPLAEFEAFVGQV